MSDISERGASVTSNFPLISDDSTVIYTCPEEKMFEDADFETAIYHSKNGKFQTILLGVSGLVYASCAISVMTLSFVLPSAGCDFDLSSVDKGKLSAMPLIGMIFGCSIWGPLANYRGRKIAMMTCLFLDFLAAEASALVHTLDGLLICRFVGGFAIIGAISIVFSYLGEFLARSERDSMLLKLEIFWSVGVIILPGVAWGLLNKKFIQTALSINLSAWRIFVSVCGFPSLLSFALLYLLPETPKFLMSKGKYSEARFVFQKIFAFNTGNSPKGYPIKSLMGEFVNNNNSVNIIAEQSEGLVPKFHELASKLRNLFSEITILFSLPHIKFLSITCLADFGFMASYYTLAMWFPEIFERYNTYESAYPDRSAGICVVSQMDETEEGDSSLYNCDSSIQNKVFIQTIIIGISCLPTSLSLSWIIEKIGKRTAVIGTLILSGLSTLALNMVRNMMETLILACVFEALTSIQEAVIFCIIVDIFPTNLRALALGITATSGRIGAMCGNLLFGLLLDWKCVVPIYLLGTLSIGSGLICTALPRSDSYVAVI